MSGHGILKYFHPITYKKDAPEDKDPSEGKELPNLFGLIDLGHVYRRLYHRHHDQLPAVMLT